MESRKTVYLTVGIISILLGAGCLLFSDTIWQLYYNGTETCTFDPTIAAYGVPTCGSIASRTAIFAGIGGFLIGLGPVFLFIGKVRAAPGGGHR